MYIIYTPIIYNISIALMVCANSAKIKITIYFKWFLKLLFFTQSHKSISRLGWTWRTSELPKLIFIRTINTMMVEYRSTAIHFMLGSYISYPPRIWPCLLCIGTHIYYAIQIDDRCRYSRMYVADKCIPINIYNCDTIGIYLISIVLFWFSRCKFNVKR